MMKYGILFLLFAAAALAQPATQTCADGRVLAITPFNRNPCNDTPAEPVEQQVEQKAAEMPDSFLLVYGPPPSPTGNSLQDRVARVKYEQDMRYFKGMVEEPEGYEGVSDYYTRWGLGEPVFYRGRYGDYCRWPDAPYRPAQATMFTAVHGAGVVVASWQAKLIMQGHILNDVHPFVPPALVQVNSERLQASFQ